jgi:hypothetical protein
VLSVAIRVEAYDFFYYFAGAVGAALGAVNSFMAF